MRTFFRRFAVTGGLLTLALLATCTQGSDGGEVTQVQVVAWLERGEAPLILDVRTPEEFGSGHVPGAVNIPHDMLTERVDEIDAQREREVVVYCESGRRAGMASQTLRAAGFRNVRHLAGDMSQWRAAGLATE